MSNHLIHTQGFLAGPIRTRQKPQPEDEAGQRLIPLSRLKPKQKQKLWKALKEYDPERAALFQSRIVQETAKRYGAKLCMPYDEIKEYLNADIIPE